jgi:hypothetical protein
MGQKICPHAKAYRDDEVTGGHDLRTPCIKLHHIKFPQFVAPLHESRWPVAPVATPETS